MSRFRMTPLMVLVIAFISGTMVAQTVRSIGARSFGLDDGNPAHPRVFLVDNLGSLGIDNTGNVTGVFPNSCGALLDLSSITKGFLPPRMSTLQETAICGGAPPEGLMLYNLVTHSLDVYTGSAYGQTWNAKGNFGINPVIDFVGTNDPTDLVFRTNFTERMRILANGNIGIGTPTATNTHVQITETGSQDATNITTSGLGRTLVLSNTGASNTVPLLDISRAGTGAGINVSSTNASKTNLLVLNGTVDATVSSATADNVWEERANGDLLVTGIGKFGGSIWLDGNSATHQIVTDAPVNIGTKNANTTSLITNNIQRLLIDGAGNSTFTGKVTITPSILTTNNVLVVNGIADATVANVAADNVWDERVNGDLLVTGIAKFGGSIWIDGKNPIQQILSDAPMNVGTKNNHTLALVTSGKQILTIDPDGTTNVKNPSGKMILNIDPDGTTNVNNPATGISTLNIDPNSGMTTINDITGNPIFTVDQGQSAVTVNEGSSGEFTINSTSQGFFAANITTTGKMGLEVYCTSQNGADHHTHFIDFNDASGTRGGIQGQSAQDLEADPNYQLNQSLFLANTILSAALIPLAVAAVLSASDPFEGPLAFVTGAIAVVQIAQLAISIEAYQSQDAQIHDNLGVAYTSGNGDYAEYLKRANPDDRFYPGDIVGVKNGLISKKTEGAESIYSISLAPIVLGNVPPKGEEKLYNKVGFLGQVPVKVLGIVHEGDFILASGLNDGIGIAIAPKDLKPEELPRLVGRAWTSSNLEWIKYINVAVGLNTKTIGEIMANEQSEIDALRSQVNKSASDAALLRSRLDRLESKNQVVNVRSN